ncbi:STAS domain-containing protein [Streptomyces sp. NPDC096324]|uniref:STAS domain-containing protein n=1 Tax=Streptomyces sp. NPDC096324 TaxID=3366085 RepID=UPI0037F34986
MADIHHSEGQPARLSITQATVDGIGVLTVAGELDADSVGTLRQALRIQENSASALTVLDMGAVSFMDSSAINVLVAASRDLVAAGSQLRMAALSEPVQRVVEIVGLDTIIVCCPTLAEALTI